MAETGENGAAKPIVSVDRKRTNRLKTWQIGLLALVIILALVLTLVLWRKHAKQVAPKPVCYGNMVQRASGFFDPTRSSELQSTVLLITTLPNYKLDPNCMYIITTYYLNVRDAKNAQDSLAQLQKVQNNQKLSSYLTPFGSINDLAKLVQFLSKETNPQNNGYIKARMY